MKYRETALLLYAFWERWCANRSEQLPWSLDPARVLTHQEAEVGLDELASAVTLEQYLVDEKVSVFLLERPEYASP